MSPPSFCNDVTNSCRFQSRLFSIFSFLTHSSSICFFGLYPKWKADFFEANSPKSPVETLILTSIDMWYAFDNKICEKTTRRSELFWIDACVFHDSLEEFRVQGSSRVVGNRYPRSLLVSEYHVATALPDQTGTLHLQNSNDLSGRDPRNFHTVTST